MNFWSVILTELEVIFETPSQITIKTRRVTGVKLLSQWRNRWIDNIMKMIRVTALASFRLGQNNHDGVRLKSEPFSLKFKFSSNRHSDKDNRRSPLRSESPWPAASQLGHLQNLLSGWPSVSTSS